MRLEEAKQELYGNYCRSCINDILGVHLKPNECYYQYYSQICPGCGERHHLVTEAAGMGKVKLFIMSGKRINNMPELGTSH
ncbi:MAG: hypothetical protein K6E30_02370 [Lachnospiraceae bacterium]|nr:hypothetical protein [Lachnospiraceae bacterium]